MERSDALLDALVALQQGGLVRHDDPLQLARFIWAIVHGIARLAIDGQLHGAHAETETLTRFATIPSAPALAAQRTDAGRMD